MLRGRGLGWNDKMNIRKLLLMFRYAQEQLKTLTSCNQKVSDLGAIVITSVARR